MNSKFFIKTFLIISILFFTHAASAQVKVEDMDEDDWINQRDTSMLSRKNRTTGQETKYNAIQYVVNDTYKPENETFSSAYFLDNVYVGASAGIEGVLKDRYVNGLTTLGKVNLFVGKEFSPLHSVRLSVSGAMGFSKGTSDRYMRFNFNGDYLYNITNHLCGYRSTRRLQVSLLGGFGVGVAKIDNVKSRFCGDAHAGVQFKIYTGPFGSIAIEPYVSYNNDGVDLSDGTNWRRFDWAYGISAGYIFYTQDDLTRESRMKLLQMRLKGDRLIDRQSLESWRTPWFAQVSMGGVSGSALSDEYTNTKYGITSSPGNGRGNITNANIGRWMSPVIGMRVGIGTRMTNWMQTEETLLLNGLTAEGSEAVKTANYGSRFAYGKVEMLFNPLGFMKNFYWDAPFGGYLFVGLEAGQMTKYTPYDEKVAVFSGGYDIGMNLWYRLSKDLQVFVEPTFSCDYYKMRINHGQYGRNNDMNFALNIGLTMLLRSARYRDPEEFDDIQNYNYRDIEGLSIGVAGGGSILQRRQDNYGHSNFNYDFMAYAQYRLNHLHGIRLAFDVMKLNSNIPVYGYYMLKSSNTMLITSLNYELNVTNLCSGRFRDRTFELEAFAGPAVGTIVRGPKVDQSTFWGLDFGLKLSYPVYKGVSVFLQPTFYALNKATIPNANPVGVSNKFQLYQSVTLGVEIDTKNVIDFAALQIGKLRNKINKSWPERQKEAIKRYQDKQRERIIKRHANDKKQ